MPDGGAPGARGVLDARGSGFAADPASTALHWSDACLALSLLAVDLGLAGIGVRAQAGPVRDAWLALIPAVFPKVRRMPAAIGDAALLGGLDLAATLQAGRPVLTGGLLADAAGGLVLAAMAERMPAGVAARLTGAMDAGTGFGVVALDEGITADEAASPALLDRLAFRVDLTAVSRRQAAGGMPDAVAVAAAKALLGEVTTDGEMLEALCGTALALGIGSARAPLLTLRAARAAAALDGRKAATVDDAALAVRLVLVPRATRLPATEPAPEDETAGEDRAPPRDGQAPDQQRDEAPEQGSAPEQDRQTAAEMSELLVEVARAAIPAGLLAQLEGQDFRGKAAGQGREGARQKGAQRGRPVGVRAASPGGKLRLNLIETLRAAAPWQTLRWAGAAPTASGRVLLRREDFRVTRTEQRGRSTTIFVVDASGSSALNRLAEAKGAVELLLADCYLRRDQVAVVAFRGRGAQVLLPPTRSLVRAKRSLAGLPGGGGTPLAAGIDAGFLLAEAARRGGAAPLLVVLTDGRANVTRAGAGGRAVAGEEAETAGRRVRAAGYAALVLDTSPRPAPEAGRLAAAMGALYVPLPYANAAAVSGAVRAAMAA